MSGDRKTRRRFMADLLFAGGALTAASVMGYVATHQVASGEKTPEVLPDGTPCQLDTPTPAQTACPADLQPSGAAPPPPLEVVPQRQTQLHPLPRDPMAPLTQERQDIRPAGGIRYQPPAQAQPPR